MVRVLLPLFAAAAVGVSPAQELAPLVGTVTDPSGAPVADAVVHVDRGEGRGFRCLDLELRDSWRELAMARTDATGRFGVQLPLGLFLRVVVDHPDFAVARRIDVVPGEEVAVQLGKPCRLTGRLRLADGTPATGLIRGWADELLVCAGRTAADGTFAFARLPAGPLMLDVEADGAVAPMVPDQVLSPAEETHVEVELAAGRELTGVVTDAATGAPIPGARIGEGWTQHKGVRSGADGRYCMPGFGDPGRPELVCTAAGYADGVVRDLPGVDAPARVDIALQRGAELSGAVVDAAGTPIAGAYVAATQGDPRQMHVFWLSTRTDDGGRYRLDRLQAGERSALLVRCDGYATAVYHLRPVDAEYGLDLGRITLRPARLVRGVLRDGNEPVGGAKLELCGLNDDAGRWGGASPYWWLLQNYLARRSTRTDAHGRFAFGDVAAGSYELELGTLAAPYAVADVDVTPGVDPAPLELVR